MPQLNFIPFILTGHIEDKRSPLLSAFLGTITTFNQIL